MPMDIQEEGKIVEGEISASNQECHESALHHGRSTDRGKAIDRHMQPEETFESCGEVFHDAYMYCIDQLHSAKSRNRSHRLYGQLVGVGIVYTSTQQCKPFHEVMQRVKNLKEYCATTQLNERDDSEVMIEAVRCLKRGDIGNLSNLVKAQEETLSPGKDAARIILGRLLLVGSELGPQQICSLLRAAMALNMNKDEDADFVVTLFARLTAMMFTLHFPFKLQMISDIIWSISLLKIRPNSSFCVALELRIVLLESEFDATLLCRILWGLAHLNHSPGLTLTPVLQIKLLAFAHMMNATNLGFIMLSLVKLKMHPGRLVLVKLMQQAAAISTTLTFIQAMRCIECMKHFGISVDLPKVDFAKYVVEEPFHDPPVELQKLVCLCFHRLLNDNTLGKEPVQACSTSASACTDKVQAPFGMKRSESTQICVHINEKKRKHDAESGQASGCCESKSQRTTHGVATSGGSNGRVGQNKSKLTCEAPCRNPESAEMSCLKCQQQQQDFEKERVEMMEVVDSYVKQVDEMESKVKEQCQRLEAVKDSERMIEQSAMSMEKTRKVLFTLLMHCTERDTKVREREKAFAADEQRFHKVKLRHTKTFYDKLEVCKAARQAASEKEACAKAKEVAVNAKEAEMNKILLLKEAEMKVRVAQCCSEEISAQEAVLKGRYVARVERVRTQEAILKERHAELEGKMRTQEVLLKERHAALEGKVRTQEVLLKERHAALEGKVRMQEVLLKERYEALEEKVRTREAAVVKRENKVAENAEQLRAERAEITSGLIAKRERVDELYACQVKLRGELDRRREESRELRGVVNAKKADLNELLARLREMEDELLCSVCMEKDIDTMLAPCGHSLFCHGCIESWSKGSDSLSCPTCRVRVEKCVRFVPGLKGSDVGTLRSAFDEKKDTSSRGS